MILGLFLSNAILVVVLLHQISSPAAAAKIYDIVQYGAKSDSKTDDSKNALSKAWFDACHDKSSATVLVPPGTFTLSSIVFQGPCKRHVTFQINGTLVAPSVFDDHLEFWVLFDDVDRVTIRGGALCDDDAYHLDGNGADLWDCKKKKGDDECPTGRRTLGIMHSNNVSISKLRFLNSHLFHITVDESEFVSIRNVLITAPEDSPNTDGIHIEKSCNVFVYNSEIGTGDDCVSIGPASRNVWINHVRCGPGHGLSIGSLGRSKDEEGVANVTVSNSMLTETQNGVRIKTFPTQTTSFARRIVFEHIKMKNVSNPILIDQLYCPNGHCLNSDQGSSSGAKLSEITYLDITGTSWTQIVMRVSCSDSMPCDEIKMTDIKLKYVKDDKPAQTICSNAVNTIIDDTVEPKIDCSPDH